jgi:hypothetical protein
MQRVCVEEQREGEARDEVAHHGGGRSRASQSGAQNDRIGQQRHFEHGVGCLGRERPVGLGG